jgi:hypothetical protein
MLLWRNWQKRWNKCCFILMIGNINVQDVLKWEGICYIDFFSVILYQQYVLNVALYRKRKNDERNAGYST